MFILVYRAPDSKPIIETLEDVKQCKARLRALHAYDVHIALAINECLGIYGHEYKRVSTCWLRKHNSTCDVFYSPIGV